MSDEMKARSGFTGIPIVVYGFDEANRQALKIERLNCIVAEPDPFPLMKPIPSVPSLSPRSGGG